MVARCLLYCCKIVKIKHYFLLDWMMVKAIYVLPVYSAIYSNLPRLLNETQTSDTATVVAGCCLKLPVMLIIPVMFDCMQGGTPQKKIVIEQIGSHSFAFWFSKDDATHGFISNLLEMCLQYIITRGKIAPIPYSRI